MVPVVVAVVVEVVVVVVVVVKVVGVVAHFLLRPAQAGFLLAPGV